MRINVV